ncbi:MAG: sugar phosphate nucleotidyltransferase [candidate division Zixibacteria bacterium]|nr:sugar phosphate nucleotidyltransferase [candidate division Zixibacteria bacterium]MDH3937533.1 sugar phosphate nucleotidyltransferase [candidate division Zixibacteria bacterium]MDH4034386.1 sugar phosphate nucleotidyltransferase [candidate division Zixibacteria bacterium]
MEAVILAGGKGTRLQPLTDEIPKPLAPVGDRPIIEILLTRMKQCGVTRVHVAVNHLAHLIKAAIGDGERFGLEIVYAQENQPLSTVGPVKTIPTLPDHFLVANGDILTDLDFGKLFDHHLKSNAGLTVAVHHRINTVDYGVLETDSDGLVTSFTEKPEQLLSVSMGVYVFSRELLAVVPEGRPFGFDDLMLKLLEQGEAVGTYRYDGYWLDIGRLEDYHQAQRDIARVQKLFG